MSFKTPVDNQGNNPGKGQTQNFVVACQTFHEIYHIWLRGHHTYCLQITYTVFKLYSANTASNNFSSIEMRNHWGNLVMLVLWLV